MIKRKKKNTESIEILMELIEIAFVHILHDRKLYPAEIFADSTHYGVPRKVCAVEMLEIFLAKQLSSLRPMIEQRGVHYFSMNVVDRNARVVEKFIFAVNFDTKVPLIYAGTVEDIQQQVRNLIVKISTTCGSLPKLPDASTFNFEVEGNILLLDIAKIVNETVENRAEFNPASVIPITSISVPPWSVELYIEDFEIPR